MQKNVNWKLILQTLFYVLLLLLVSSNIILLTKNTRQKAIAQDREYDLPRIGHKLPNCSLTTHSGNSVQIPAVDKTGTIIYFSNANSYSLGEIGLLNLISDVNTGKQFTLIVISLGDDDRFSLLQRYVSPNISLIRDTKDSLQQLERTRPKPNTIIVSVNGEIMYEGEIIKKWLYELLNRFIDKDMTPLMNAISQGTRITGTIVNETKEIEISNISGVFVLHLYPTYCNTCGDHDLYVTSNLIGDISVYAVFPYLVKYEEYYSYLSSRKGVIIFSRLLQNSSQITLDHFLLNYPLTIVLRDSKVVFVSSPNMTINEIVDKIIVAYREQT